MKRWLLRTVIVVSGSAAAALTTGSVRAQSAAAQELFEAAKKLTKEGKYAEACPKFEESQRLDPAPGNLFFLADCWEQIGRKASAWAAYVQVADQSNAANQKDREKVARERANALAPKLSRLSVVVPADSRVPGLVVKRDGVVLREAQWGIPVPVDPGSHLIEANAAGARPWQTSTGVSGEGKTTTVEVPKLVPAPADASSTEPPLTQANQGSNPELSGQQVERDSAAGTGSTQRTIGLVVGGLGVAAIGVGSYFGLKSMSKHDDYVPRCPNNVCDPTGKELHDEAVTAGNISTIAFGAGIAALTTGVVLYLTAPKANSSSGMTLGPVFGTRSGALRFQGMW